MEDLFNNSTESEINRLMPKEYIVKVYNHDMTGEEITRRVKLQIKFRREYHQTLKK